MRHRLWGGAGCSKEGPRGPSCQVLEYLSGDPVVTVAMDRSEEESNVIYINDNEPTKDLLKLLDELKGEVDRDCELESDNEDEEYWKLISQREDLIKRNKEKVECYIKLQREGITKLITELKKEEDLKSKMAEELDELDVKRAKLHKMCEEKDESLTQMKEEKQELQESVPKKIDKIKEKIRNLRKELNNVKIKQAEYNRSKKVNIVIDGPNIPLLEYISKKIEAKEEELGCPVCFELASEPIFMCSEEHLVCSTCRPKLSQCPQCRKVYKKGFKRHRHAEKAAEELGVLYRERADVLGSDSDGEKRDNLGSAQVDTGKMGLPIRALYDYEAEEPDELTFKSGDEFEKLEDEDEHGWCKGKKDGRVGFYPATYVEPCDDLATMFL